jgi:hypothetical protein
MRGRCYCVTAKSSVRLPKWVIIGHFAASDGCLLYQGRDFRSVPETDGKSGERSYWRGRVGRSVVMLYPTMRPLRTVAILALLLAARAAIWPDGASAQEINFDQINKFESLGTGTLHVGAPPKTIIDDGERHVVVLTIWDADAETKVYWRSPDGNDPRTTVIPGKGIQTFQTAGEFKLEAVGEPNREVNYGYVLLGLRKR